MDFLDDYWLYHSKYEVPRNYVFWSAIALLGAVVNRKVHFLHGDIELHANVYVLMVGPVGNGKSTCCDFAAKLFSEVCSDLPVGASTQSAEDIVQTMAKEDFLRVFTNEVGEQVEIRPYAFFINEFKDFIAYAPTRMLNFLTNIYDRKAFKASTIKRGLEDIINPSLNILGCENPDQLVGMMKNSIITGGASRRFILVYETDYTEPKPFIDIADNSPERLAWQRVKQRLIDVRSVVGKFQWTPDGRKFYEPWYVENKKSLASMTNVVMQGYKSTKHIQLFKVAMLLDACSDKPMLCLTGPLLERTLPFLDVIEKNMPKLSLASGRNDMIIPQHKMLDIISSLGGCVTEKRLRKEIEGELKSYEIDNILSHLEATEQILKNQGRVPGKDMAPTWLIWIPEYYQQCKVNGAIKTPSQTQA